MIQGVKVVQDEIVSKITANYPYYSLTFVQVQKKLRIQITLPTVVNGGVTDNPKYTHLALEIKYMA